MIWVLSAIATITFILLVVCGIIPLDDLADFIAALADHFLGINDDD